MKYLILKSLRHNPFALSKSRNATSFDLSIMPQIETEPIAMGYERRIYIVVCELGDTPMPRKFRPMFQNQFCQPETRGLNETIALRLWFKKIAGQDLRAACDLRVMSGSP